MTRIADATGQLRFPALPPGSYVLDIKVQGFKPWQEEDVYIGAGDTIDIQAVLKQRPGPRLQIAGGVVAQHLPEACLAVVGREIGCASFVQQRGVVHRCTGPRRQ